MLWLAFASVITLISLVSSSHLILNAEEKHKNIFIDSYTQTVFVGVFLLNLLEDHTETKLNQNSYKIN